MNFENFKQLFDSIIKSNPVAKISPRLLLFDLTGIGENLLNKDFIKILRYMKSKGVTVSFATNATLLDRKKSEELIKTGVDLIFLSIDGATKETYERIRKGANFEKVKNNIISFNEIRKSLKKKKPKFVIRFLVSSVNIKEMPMMIDLAKSIGVKIVSITKLNTSKKNKYLLPDDKLFEELRKETIERAGKQELDVDFGFTKTRPITSCKRPFNSMYISSEGFVLPCCFINQGGKYEEIKKKYNLGNVFKTNIKDIWNSKNFKELRKTIRQGKAPPVCRDCYLYYPLK